MASPPGVGTTTDGMDGSIMKLQFQAPSYYLIALLLGSDRPHLRKKVRYSIQYRGRNPGPGTDIHYKMSRHKKRKNKEPERHDTGSHTIREKGKTLVSSGGPSRSKDYGDGHAPQSPFPFLMIQSKRFWSLGSGGLRLSTLS